MIILLSPTKKQQRHPLHSIQQEVIFKNEKNVILNILKQLDKESIQSDFKISDKLAQDTFEAFQNIDESSPAIYTYTGEAFKTLDPKSMSSKSLNLLNDHLLIFSALYGLLKPFTPITLYRLDFLNKFEINLKRYWSDTVTQYLNEQNKTLVNLASQEFSQLIQKDKLMVPILNIHFLNEKNGKRTVVSSHAKKARGHFARVLLEKGLQSITTIQVEGYQFSHQEDNHYYYIKTV